MPRIAGAETQDLHRLGFDPVNGSVITSAPARKGIGVRKPPVNSSRLVSAGNMKSRLQAATGAWRVSDDARQALVAEVERHAANLLEAATLAYGREQSARIAQGIKGRLNFSLRHAQHAIETSGGSLKSGTPVAAAWPTTPGPEEVTV